MGLSFSTSVGRLFLLSRGTSHFHSSLSQSSFQMRSSLSTQLFRMMLPAALVTDRIRGRSSADDHQGSASLRDFACAARTEPRRFRVCSAFLSRSCWLRTRPWPPISRFRGVAFRGAAGFSGPPPDSSVVYRAPAVELDGCCWLHCQLHSRVASR